VILARMGAALEQPDSVPQETMNLLCACIATLLRSLDSNDVNAMAQTVVEVRATLLTFLFSSLSLVTAAAAAAADWC